MVFFWPFKTGTDDVFHASDEQRPEVYESIGGTPKYTFEKEYRRYQSRKWRKGLIHTMAPACVGGALVGGAIGVWESRRGLLRHVSRPKIILNQVVAVGGLSVAIALSHHAIVMACSYEEFAWQPMAAGSMGGVGYALMVSGSMSGPAVLSGFVVGILYSVAMVGIGWYQHRHMHSFLSTQQMRETPIHRVSPEMQMMYRAYLYDHRPLEELDDLRRRALTNMRTDKDVRLDAQAYREAMKLQPLWDQISFPEWWPVKFSEKDVLMDQRMRDDAHSRRKDGFLNDPDGQYMLTHLSRTEQGRSASGE